MNILETSRYDAQAAKGLKASSLYNLLTSLLHASDYCYTCLGRRPPNGFIRHLKQLRRKQSRHRKACEQDILEEQSLRGTPDLRPLVALLKRPSVLEEFAVICDRSSAILEDRDQFALRKQEYLFAMRLCLGHVMVSSAARTSAVYTLTVSQVDKALGDWAGVSPVVFRNNLHKTASTSGHARLCVSGIGKSLLSMFFLVIRKAFLTSNGLPESVFMFVDSVGKQMSSSSVSKHLLSFQRCEGFEHPYTPTRIRKCICSQIKSPQGQGVGGQLARAVAKGLLHTVQTSENYYTVGRRDYVALELHRAIVKFYGL